MFTVVTSVFSVPSLLSYRHLLHLASGAIVLNWLSIPRDWFKKEHQFRHLDWGNVLNPPACSRGYCSTLPHLLGCVLHIGSCVLTLRGLREWALSTQIKFLSKSVLLKKSTYTNSYKIWIVCNSLMVTWHLLVSINIISLYMRSDMFKCIEDYIGWLHQRLKFRLYSHAFIK